MPHLTPQQPQEGFTLVELLIVVLIIGILAAISIPVFNGQRERSRNGVAQSNLTNAYHAARSYYATTEAYPAVADLAGQLATDEPTLDFKVFATGSSESQNPKDITVTVEDKNMTTLCNKSASGLYYCLRGDSLGALASAPVVTEDDGSSLASLFLAATAHAADADAGTVARSTGRTEPAARAALPSRTAAALITPDNAIGWSHCTGTCSGTSLVFTMPPPGGGSMPPPGGGSMPPPGGGSMLPPGGGSTPPPGGGGTAFGFNGTFNTTYCDDGASMENPCPGDRISEITGQDTVGTSVDSVTSLARNFQVLENLVQPDGRWLVKVSYRCEDPDENWVIQLSEGSGAVNANLDCSLA